MTWILEGFMRQYESVWHERLRKGESFSLLAVFEQVKDELWKSIGYAATRGTIGDFQKTIECLRWLELRRKEGNTQAAQNRSVA